MLPANLKKLDIYVVAIVLLSIFGFIVRIYNLGYQSIAYDEGSVNAAFAYYEAFGTK